MNVLIRSIRAEFARYKALAEGAFVQVDEPALSLAPFAGGNSLAAMAWHISGNLSSRFTDFLDSDGEKPWRNREEEFAARSVTRDELGEKWEKGWSTLFATLDSLSDSDLTRTVTIRRQPLAVHEALHRSLAHISYHVGQIVVVGRQFRGSDWKFLSIPPGQSDAYNRNPGWEKPDAHVQTIAGSKAS